MGIVKLFGGGGYEEILSKEIGRLKMEKEGFFKKRKTYQKSKVLFKSISKIIFSIYKNLFSIFFYYLFLIIL